MPADSHPETYTYPRYLTAKETVDARALNRRVWNAFIDRLPHESGRATRIVEVGAGTGATAKRLIRALASSPVEELAYTLVEIEPNNLDTAREELLDWAKGEDFDVWGADNRIVLTGGPVDASLTLVEADLFDFVDEYADPPADAVIAQAVLDLLDISNTLQEVTTILRNGGLWYLPIHYDGVTTFEPVVDASLDRQIEHLYHESMRDEEGGRDGATAGRRLLSSLRSEGMDLVEVGASDWIVLADSDGAYPGDEGYFLHHILYFIEQELTNHPEIDAEAFSDWLDVRHGQITSGELIYIAHQLDVLALKPAG